MQLPWLRTIPSNLNTPAFIYDECAIVEVLQRLGCLRREPGCKILFSLKSFAFIDALRVMVPMVDGFAASSLFEATVGREVLAGSGTIHLTTPGLRFDEMKDIAEICDYISFNSLSQWTRLNELACDRVSLGLRVNPQQSFASDERYDPCRRHSKLGIPISALVGEFEKVSALPRLQGLHFHANCEANSFEPLLQNVRKLNSQLAVLLSKLTWINLGGGYQYGQITDADPLIEAINLLRTKFELEVFIEPGQAIVGEAGYIASSVLDIFESDGRNVAVLDTSINHMPQVFEYQFQPDVMGANEFGNYTYVLAGATCLAGDIFGHYRFDKPLEIGSLILFENVGAYSLVKANMFNGLNLPSIYALTSDNELRLKKHFSIEQYRSRWA